METKKNNIYGDMKNDESMSLYFIDKLTEHPMMEDRNMLIVKSGQSRLTDMAFKDISLGKLSLPNKPINIIESIEHMKNGMEEEQIVRKRIDDQRPLKNNRNVNYHPEQNKHSDKQSSEPYRDMDGAVYTEVIYSAFAINRSTLNRRIYL